MNLRPSSMLVRCALTLATLSLFACVLEPDDSSGSRPEYGDTEDHEQPLVDVTCFTEDPGCGCAPGSAPIDCTLTEVRGDLVLCEAGASYCVEGVWSECETVESWEMPRPKVISAPGACSPCNPDCFQTNDLPDQTDITTPPPGITSNNVQFVTGPPRGIRPIPNMTMMTGGVDTDMDGVPDSADACPAVVGMTRFFGCPTGVGTGGFFHVLPPGATAQDPLAFNVQLREADIYILVDRTGSMGGEIDNLRTGLATMMANIRTTIPDTWFGVGRFDDLPDDVYGTSSSNTNRMYYNLLDLNSSLSAAQTAVNTLATIPSGGDWPEANSQALYSMASGLGLNLFGTQYNNNRTGCPAGRWGYPCFRPNVIPIVILITDAESHNGPTGLNYRRSVALPETDFVTTLAQGNNNNNAVLGTLPAGSVVVLTGGTSSATDNNLTRCNTGTDSSPDRLFQFTITQPGIYEFDTAGSNFDTMLSLTQGVLGVLTTQLGCDDDAAGSNDSFFTANLAAGTYTLRIDGHSTDSGNFVIRITPPRAILGDLYGRVREYTGSTTLAPNNFPTRCNGGSDSSRDRLVEFTVSQTAEYIFDLSNSDDYDTMLGLYSGTAPTAGLLQCDDDSGSGDRSRIIRTLTPGTYTLRIDGNSTDNGNFVLRAGEQRFTYSGVSYAAAMAAMNARNIRFIGVNSGNGVAGADLNSMAADTNSLDSNGVAFTQTIASDGSGLTNAMVTAVQNLANYSRMDVDVVVQNINILPGVPASALVQSITLDAPACAVRCTGAITNGCSQCLPGTNLPFRVTFRNNVIMPTAVDQVFNFDLIVRGNLGAIELQRVPVRIVVPANVATTTYMSGTFSRTFSASDTCEIPPTRPDWGLFGWEIATPGTSSVAFQIRTAETLAELNAMAPLTYTVPGTLDVPTPAQYIDLGDMIVAAGGRNFLPFLRVTAVLTPSADGLQPPTLTSMGLQYGCVDSE